MRTQHRGHFYLALAAVLVTALAGCGGGGNSGGSVNTGGQIGNTGTGSGNGITATATVSGNTVAITAHTTRSDIAQIWATVTGFSGQSTLTGSGNDYSTTVQITADASSIITVTVNARDSVGSQLGPAQVQVRMGEFGTESAVIGTIINSDDRTAVQGATVTLGNQTATTDSTGKFVFTDLVVGSTLEGVVNKSGFSESRFTVTVTNETVNVGQVSLRTTQDVPPAAPVFP